MTRIDRILTNALFKDYLEKTAVKEVARKFCRHNLQHLIDTARIAYILTLEAGQGEQLDKEIVYTAALLHDIGRWQEYETGEDHAYLGSLLARPILEESGFVEEEILVICQGILEHRKLPDKPSRLGYYLYRGDKLSRPCLTCKAKEECYKINSMETAKTMLVY